MNEKNHENCPLTQALLVIGGKWKPLIISHLQKSPKRFGQLHTLIPKLSRKVLTSQLQELTRDKLITRHSYAETPPRVEYRLTEKSKELVPIFQSMSKWGMYLIDKKIIEEREDN
ncbi:DNA-binding HxlR family transcriptional regulator [Wenyingzhuangia heitensis]|uniref:DNA-binding HxlR family transcriptional regulator n=1 Tax=Wenyingzhuangia heitensis TaxID=1487859 RepID=A0ABX0U9U6_9FLAO|nr:helix-turn-helix domain-containing protein [Wenyingzhuangia heitensis]NIJ45599.1 DNA-binding HxlR family transcriptional regulator [Wenyingzhuangia heitensis]